MLRTAGRRYEFDAWHVECKAQRNILKSINIAFLAVVASFTFTLCLLLAASYVELLCLFALRHMGTLCKE